MGALFGRLQAGSSQLGGKKARQFIRAAALQAGSLCVQWFFWGVDCAEEFGRCEHRICINTDTIDSQAFFCQSPRVENATPHTQSTLWVALGPPPPTYRRLQALLSQIPWIAQATVVCRCVRRRIRGRTVKRGPYYLWTCKVRAKTFCVALSKPQYRLLAKAIDNNRTMQKTLQRMQTITLNTILQKVPGVRKRK